MRLGKYVLVAFSAVSMAGSPVLAQAADGSSVVARTGARVESAEGLSGNGILSGGGFVLPLIALMAVALAVLVGTGNDSTPVSP
ncbi:MAG: hypothetical protein J7493_09140 [Porphyrobacter sp.]|nr:hypothetical protein [Porphyrobacter sp.]